MEKNTIHVLGTHKGSPAEGIVKKGDAIVKIDGVRLQFMGRDVVDSND